MFHSTLSFLITCYISLIHNSSKMIQGKDVIQRSSGVVSHRPTIPNGWTWKWQLDARIMMAPARTGAGPALIGRGLARGLIGIRFHRQPRLHGRSVQSSGRYSRRRSPRPTERKQQRPSKQIAFPASSRGRYSRRRSPRPTKRKQQLPSPEDWRDLLVK